MKLTFQSPARLCQRTKAFTLIEVALSLAIIGFALVAIIGVLPKGMQVQKENREDTVIIQDGQALVEALKNGQTNMLQLAENLEWIELYTDGVRQGFFNRQQLLTNSITTNELAYRIIGLLSIPRFEPATNAAGYVSNYVRAKFVANSGPLADRLTQAPNGSRDLSFAYLVTVNIDRAQVSQINSNGLVTGNDSLYGMYLYTNMYDLRVTLSWPVYPNTNTGNGRKSFHTVVAGKLVQDTNALYRFYPGQFIGN
jgi:type II secretory pathway pseudopilin PulG